MLKVKVKPMLRDYFDICKLGEGDAALTEV
jgi:hypothetical protein